MSVIAPRDEAMRRRGLNGLLVYTFFMVIGFAMLMPLVAVHFVGDVGLGAALVGLALAVRQVVQQGLALVGGILADRLGARPMICAGVALRAIGFGALAFADDAGLLFVAMVLSALGGALFEAPYQAAIAALTTEATRTRYYALSNWIIGVATMLGPLLGVALLHFDFQIVCAVAAACFALNFAIALGVLPRLSMPEHPPALSHGLSLVLRDRRFLMLVAIMSGYWFIAVQLNISIPLLAQRLTGTADSIGVLFALSAGLTVVLQIPLVRALERRLGNGRVLILGVVTMALSIGMIAIVGGFTGLLLCIGAYAIGALLTLPTQQALIAGMANARALGTYLGISSLSLAIGGSLGNVVGGWLLDAPQAARWPALPWLLFAAVGLASAAGLWCLGVHRRARPSADQPTPIAV